MLSSTGPILQLLLEIILTMLLASGARADMFPRVEVPQLAIKGASANASCRFEVLDEGLYSLKWYHNDTEFYRYVPNETNGPVHVKPSSAFTVKEWYRSNSHVALSLENLTMDATGEYKCEVIAEHPSFRTEADKGSLTVLEEALTPPVVLGVQSRYQPSDLISIRCEARPISLPNTPPVLTWYLHGRPANEQLVTTYHQDRFSQTSAITLTLPAHQAITYSSSTGGTVEVECRLTLGPLMASQSRTLWIASSNPTPLHSYHSKGCRDCPALWTTLLLTQVTPLLLLASPLY